MSPSAAAAFAPSDPGHPAHHLDLARDRGPGPSPWRGRPADPAGGGGRGRRGSLMVFRTRRVRRRAAADRYGRPADDAGTGRQSGSSDALCSELSATPLIVRPGVPYGIQDAEAGGCSTDEQVNRRTSGPIRTLSPEPSRARRKAPCGILVASRVTAAAERPASDEIVMISSAGRAWVDEGAVLDEMSTDVARTMMSRSGWPDPRPRSADRTWTPPASSSPGRHPTVVAEGLFAAAANADGAVMPRAPLAATT